MSTDNEKNSNKVSETINAVTGLVKSVPVYSDAIQPAAKETGKSLELVAKTVNAALSPLKLFVWSVERLQDFFNSKVAEKMQDIPNENIITPKSNIAVPAMQALMYSGDDPDLQEMFANLLATSMNIKTSHFAHPSFVDTIKQLTSDEAKLLRYFSNTNILPAITIRSEYTEIGKGGFDLYKHVTVFGPKAGCENSSMVSVGIDNLIRLGIIEIPDNVAYTDKKNYEEVKNNSEVVGAIDEINKTEGQKAIIVEEIIQITNFGNQFIKVCVNDYRENKPEKQ